MLCGWSTSDLANWDMPFLTPGTGSDLGNMKLFLYFLSYMYLDTDHLYKRKSHGVLGIYMDTR